MQQNNGRSIIQTLREVYGLNACEETLDEPEVIEPVAPKNWYSQHTYDYYGQPVAGGAGAGGGYGSGSVYGQELYEDSFERGESYAPNCFEYIPSYSNKYSWASGFSYKVNDLTKLKKQLNEKQKKLNRRGMPIKIMYGTESMSRRISGITRISATTVSHVDMMVKFLDKTKAIGVINLGPKDEKLMYHFAGRRGAYIPSQDRNVEEEELNEALKDKTKYLALRDIIEEDKEDDEIDGGGENWGGRAPSIKDTCEKEDIMKIADQLKNKLKMKDTLKIKNESIRKGQRINRKYVQKMSYKPLVTNKTEIIPKKRALCVVDGSGSMYSSMKSGKMMVKAASEFMYAIDETSIFECQTIFSNSHSITSGSKQYPIYRNGGGEGFYQLSDRLDDAKIMVKDFDYIFIFSDLDIGSSDLGALKDMVLSSRAKHIMFNFNTPEYTERVSSQYSELTVKNIQNTSDMVSTLINYV